jgi:serine/threonine protein kinase
MGRDESAGDKFPKKFGKYHLLGPLAQGGMGALYLAVTGDRGLERLMVIKTILPHLADAEYISRFRDEAKIVVKLSHGNLIPVFDAGMIGHDLFLAMDFVEGRDLRAIWNRCAKKQVAFPIDIAVFIVKELCRGLGYAHEFPDLDLVHRDVSPPNVLLSFSGEVKLTDFGLASSTLKMERTVPGIIYGKVAYMSPEQARGETLDGRSDQYAVGIVLWELLTGRQLFPPGKDQPQDLMARAKNPEVQRPSKRAPRVPVELDEICLRALNADKDARYPSCEHMRKALQAWLAKNAPTTDASRVSTFLHELFDGDIERDRAAREEMIQGVRQRSLTLAPTDELRQIMERGTLLPLERPEPEVNGVVRTPGSVGRRSTDRGISEADRRREADRRAGRAGRAATPGPQAAEARAEFDADFDVDFEIDNLVDGRYRIIDLIGEGGMGKVYLAEHEEIGRKVAIKVLHANYSRMPDLVERFRREARAASRIGNPHIVDITDSGTSSDGSVYFVMEYLEGVELAQLIKRDGALDVARALRVASQISRALSVAHGQGIIHRDLKPENIFLVRREGTADFVKVLDFGIAKTTEAEEVRERRLTSPGMAMGTPEYMAPEQAAGRPADARCDVYALGAILYEMLTGDAPYQGANFMEILAKKATSDPTPPMVLRRGISPEVNDLVIRAMARQPEERLATMDAFDHEVTRCLSGAPAGTAASAGLLVQSRPGTGGLEAGGSGVRRPVRGSGGAVAVAAGGSMVNLDTDPVRSRKLGPAGWALSAMLVAASGALAWALLVRSDDAGSDDGKAGAAIDDPVAAVADPDQVRDPEAPPHEPGDRVASAPPVAVDAGVIIPQVTVPSVATKPQPRAEPRPASRPEVKPSKPEPAKISVEIPVVNSEPKITAAPPGSDSEALDLLRQADQYLANGKDVKASSLYTRVAQGDHRAGNGLIGLGKIAVRSGHLKVAYHHFEKARSMGARAAAPLMAEVAMSLGNHRKAVEIYRGLLQNDPRNAGYRDAHAKAMSQCKDCSP